MAYLYRKIVNNRPYYYLRISQRINGKLIVKDVAYLGNDVKEVEEKLDKLSKYQKEIRQGYRNIKKFIQTDYYIEKVKKRKLKNNKFIDKGLFEQIEGIRLHYLKHFLKCDELTQRETYKHFIVDFAFNTTSIEGNTITLKEAQLLLREEILPSKRNLREVYDLQNTENTFFWLLDKKPRINENLLISIHDKLLDKIDIRKGYRTQEIKVFKSNFDVSPLKYIKTDMNLLIDWFKKNNGVLHPLVLAGLMHHKFERIHPFADGNGRTGRILMNYILMKHKYPPYIITKKRRSDYLNALNSADKADLNCSKPEYYKIFIKFLAEEMITSYWQNFNV